MSRKRYKAKARCCSLCRPHKRGLAPRWKSKELLLLKRFEQALSRGSDWADQ